MFLDAHSLGATPASACCPVMTAPSGRRVCVVLGFLPLIRHARHHSCVRNQQTGSGNGVAGNAYEKFWVTDSGYFAVLERVNGCIFVRDSRFFGITLGAHGGRYMIGSVLAPSPDNMALMLVAASFCGVDAYYAFSPYQAQAGERGPKARL